MSTSHIPQGGAAGSIRRFLQLESAGGIILVAGAALALLCANTPLASFYHGLLDAHFTISIEDWGISKPLLLWINDGLMALFFLLVGLELKREMLEGDLSSRRKASLPAIAALGGMLAPALIYSALNWDDARLLQGWAIPTATDIAFAVGVLGLLGSRVPPSLKLFLLALAILDDLGAIVIIALFYTADLSLHALAGATVGIAALVALNRSGVRAITPYALAGLFLWACVLKSGVHATLSGVVVAMAVPLRGTAAAAETQQASPLSRWEQGLHPWVHFMVLPVFAFANAGVSFIGVSSNDVFGTLPLGIAAGLVVGKQLGVFGAAWLAIKTGLAERPAGASWLQLYGIAALCGIGFTMSLFIGTLAFGHGEYDLPVRLGVMGGSLVSALLGYAVLRGAGAAGAR